MRRIRSAVVLAVACLAGVLASAASPAAAQTGYPPGPCSVLSGSQFAGNASVGQTFTVTVSPTCLFTGGGAATIVVNGSSPFTKAVNADGTVTVTVTVLSTTQLSVNPIVPAVCGVNTISVTAPSGVAGGRSVTQTVTFNLTCPGQGGDINICNAGDGGAGGTGAGAGGNATSSGGGTATGGTGTGTGGPGGAGGDACNVNITLTGGGGGGGGAGGAGGAGGGVVVPAGVGPIGQLQRLARSGAEVAPYLGAAAVLVLVGVGLLIAGRRRRPAKG